MQAAGTIPMNTPVINTTQLNATGTGNGGGNESLGTIGCVAVIAANS